MGGGQILRVSAAKGACVHQVADSKAQPETGDEEGSTEEFAELGAPLGCRRCGWGRPARLRRLVLVLVRRHSPHRAQWTVRGPNPVPASPAQSAPPVTAGGAAS